MKAFDSQIASDLICLSWEMITNPNKFYIGIVFILLRMKVTKVTHTNNCTTKFFTHRLASLSDFC
ncbi:hypothetical protein D3C87_1613750 [compost metagenome]